MQVPPVQFDLTSEKADPPLCRLPWVWVLFGLLFSFIIASSLTTHDKKSPLVEDTLKTRDKTLELQMCMKSVVAGKGTDRSRPMFEQQIEDLLDTAKKDPSSQKLRIVLRVEDNLAPFKDDMANLANSTNKENQAFAKLYTEPKPNKEESLTLLKQIDGSELSERIATVQVKESFGDKAIRAKTFDPSRSFGFGLIAMGAMVGLGMGLVLLYVYLYNRQAGRLVPKGMPLGSIDYGRADRLIFVALIIISTFLAAGEASKFLGNKGFSGAELLVFLPVFIAIGICLNTPIFGWKITPKLIGISFERFPEKLGWAVAAFIANIPILFILILLTSAMQKFLPGGGHPVSEELMNNPKPMELARIAFLACVLAPIWEEVFFRGLLFPAFSKVLGKPIYGALLSSFIFASIHPQGLLGIPVLMVVALMLCMVSYQTKSLISNMILHALHNGATLIAALVLMPLFK